MKALMAIDTAKFLKAMGKHANNAEIGAIRGTELAVKKVEKATLAQVPRSTGTLASSWSAEVHNRSGIVTAELGYGIKNNPKHPKTGLPVSEYVTAVHEDLQAVHPTGNAKFFEGPMLEYASSFGPDVVEVVLDELRRFGK